MIGKNKYALMEYKGSTDSNGTRKQQNYITDHMTDSDRRYIRIADKTFLACIVLELAGMFTMFLWGTLGAQMAIYAMTFAMAWLVARKNKNIHIPIGKMEPKQTVLCLGITICGIPIAMLLNAFASVLSSSQSSGMEDTTVYPFWLSLICLAIVPAVIEEYIFRGVILGAYLKMETMAAVLISSLFFGLLHLSLGSVMYGFFFGCVFALIRVITGNIAYTMLMHVTFNSLNVLLEYVNIGAVPIWVVLAVMLVCIVGFVALMKKLLHETSIHVEKKRHKIRHLMTREGYVAVGICVVIMGMLLCE